MCWLANDAKPWHSTQLYKQKYQNKKFVPGGSEAARKTPKSRVARVHHDQSGSPTRWHVRLNIMYEVSENDPQKMNGKGSLALVGFSVFLH